MNESRKKIVKKVTDIFVKRGRYLIEIQKQKFVITQKGMIIEKASSFNKTLIIKVCERYWKLRKMSSGKRYF